MFLLEMRRLDILFLVVLCYGVVGTPVVRGSFLNKNTQLTFWSDNYEVKYSLVKIYI